MIFFSERSTPTLILCVGMITPNNGVDLKTLRKGVRVSSYLMKKSEERGVK